MLNSQIPSMKRNPHSKERVSERGGRGVRERMRQNKREGVP
jgi:hypothetical protein